MEPYIGITGFTKPDEVASALQSFPNHPHRRLMIGVLATWKSLRGIPMKPRWQKQVPDPTAIPSLLSNDARAVNLVHFSTEEGQESTILADLCRIHELAGPFFQGFQLNLAWPEVRPLDEYRTAVGRVYRIVLQIGQRAVEVAGGTPSGIVGMLNRYIGQIDDVLLDPSGGLGKAFDTERARQFLSAIAEQGWNLGLGVAGGLGPDSLNLVEPLVAEFPNLSIDAQGLLRNPKNDLDSEAVRNYLTKARQLFT